MLTLNSAPPSLISFGKIYADKCVSVPNKEDKTVQRGYGRIQEFSLAWDSIQNDLAPIHRVHPNPGIPRIDQASTACVKGICRSRSGQSMAGHIQGALRNVYVRSLYRPTTGDTYSEENYREEPNLGPCH